MLKFITCFAFFCFLLSNAFAQTTIPLWPVGKIPNDLNNSSIQEKVETGDDGILRISNIKVPALTVYRPTQPNGTAVMICPGGGYWIEAAGHEGVDIAKWFNELGITAFVLKYRLPDENLWKNKHEVPLQDAMQGIKIIREQAASYGINPNKIGIIGFSAGGHLASTLSTHWHLASSPADKSSQNLSIYQPNFAILMYPVISAGPYKHAGSFERLLGKTPAPELLDFYSNEKQVSAQTPPTLLVHATDDKAVPVENSMLYYDALRKAGVSASLLVYENGGHGFGLAQKKDGSVRHWPESCKVWLKAMGLTGL
ncbi:MAG: alpha/beta hydrolase [Runella sp.]